MPSASSPVCADGEIVASKSNANDDPVLEKTDDPILEKTWWKIDLHVLPIPIMFSLLSMLVVTSLGNARIAGLQKDLEISNAQFSMIATISVIPHIVSVLPSNLALKALRPNIVIPTMMTLWGLGMILQGVVRNYSQLLVCRFFLGLLEGSFVATIALYLALWYPRQQLQRRMAAVFAPGSLAVAFGGLLAYEIVRMDGIGKRPGWSWIFILEGLFTFLVGFLSYFLLPTSPGRARFLTERERAYVLTRLAESGATSRDDQSDRFNWREVWKTFTLPHVLILVIVFFLKGSTWLAINLFTPTIVSELGYSKTNAQLYSAPPYVVAFFLTLVMSYISDRYGARGFILIFSNVLTSSGLAIFLWSTSDHVQYGSLFVTIPGVWCASPAILTWMTNNVSPYTRRATATSIGVMMLYCGGFFGIWLLGKLSAPPRYTGAKITLFVFNILAIVLVGLNIVYLTFQNRKKKVIRAVGSPEDEKKELGDRSAWFVYQL